MDVNVMEAVSCSLGYPLPYSYPNTNKTLTKTTYFTKIPKTFPFNRLPLTSSSSLIALPFNGFTTFASLPNPHTQNPSPQLSLLLEVEGVLMDVNRFGNRQAFNVAFKKLGLDCANWTEPIYLDLARKSAGDEERMLILFFNKIGWPSSLPTNEKGTFMKKVLQEKRKALDEILMSKSLPLRPGVEGFIDEAHNEGIPVVILTAYSKCGDTVARSIIEKLGEERVSKITIIGTEEAERSSYSQLVLGKGVSSSLDEQLAKEVRRAAAAEKQRIAEEVASMLKLRVNIDTTSTESSQKIVAALHAGAEYLGVSISNCMLIAGSQGGVVGADQVGMSCVVLRSSLTARAEFPSASGVMDGFGVPDLTVSGLRHKFKSIKSS